MKLSNAILITSAIILLAFLPTIVLAANRVSITDGLNENLGHSYNRIAEYEPVNRSMMRSPSYSKPLAGKMEIPENAFVPVSFDVYNENKNPLNATVAILTERNKPLTSKSTFDGSVRFDLFNGSYMIKVTSKGYRDHNAKISVKGEFKDSIKLIQAKTNAMITQGGKTSIKAGIFKFIVYDSLTGNSLKNSTVKVLDKKGSVVESKLTPDGVVSFTLPEGAYAIIASAPGYDERMESFKSKNGRTDSRKVPLKALPKKSIFAKK